MARGNGSGKDLWVELQERVTSLQEEMVTFREQVVASSTRMEGHLKHMGTLISRLADDALAVQAELT